MDIDELLLNLNYLDQNLDVLQKSTLNKDKYLSPILVALSDTLNTLNRRITYLNKESIIQSKLKRSPSGKFFIENMGISLGCTHTLEVFKNQTWHLGYVDYDHANECYYFKSFSGLHITLNEDLIVRYRE